MDAKRGTLHIFPQGAQVRKRLKAPVSRYELRVFWRRLDEDSGQASIEEFGRLMYKIELSQWPDLCEEELERIVSVLNQAAHKWHRAGGNWFKVFNQVDADGSGNLSFDELVSCVRGKFPCLRISTKQVTDKELHGLWKALDCNGGIEVPVHRFMVFMRRWSGDTGLHKGGNRQRHVHGASKASLPPVAERSDVEVRAVANALERALSSYYIDRGYLSVASASETAWHGGAKSNDSSCSWTRFFREMDKDGVGRLSYNNFLRAVFSKLKPWLNPSVALPVGGNGRSVGADHCFYSFAGFMAMQADPLEWAEKFEAEPAKQMMQRQPRAHPLPGAEEKAEPCDLFGDSRWMPLPRPKVVSPTSMPSMYQQYAPQYVGYPGYPGYPAIGAGMWPMPEPEPDLDLSKASALKTLATAMGSRVTEDMLKDVPKATFAEASRLLLAVLGFMCEGACPPMLRANVVARGPHLPLWQGLTPHMLLRDFFDADELLSLYGEESMRQAFDAATPASQGHFVTMLSRVAFIEAARPGSGRCLRAAWQGIFQLFPEISLVRALFTHIRRRCWEDCRDRSRMLWQSRSRSRDRKKTKSEANEDSQRFFLKNTGDLDDWKIQNCNVLMDKRKKQYRGMGFITLKPEGYYRGKKNTKQMMIEWVLEESHVVNGVKIDVTQADEKPEEDEDRKREDRVEERRLARLDKEQRMLRNLGGVAPHLIDRGQERLVPSPWFKRWRYRLWEVLPKNSPCSWDNPSLHSICGGLWREAVEYTTRTADKTVKDPKKGNFDDCKIFVGGLNLNTSVDQLMSSFAAYGQITDAVIMTDKITGKPRGFGFIVFESPDGVAAVLRVNDKHHVNGKWVDVKRATSDGSVRGTFDSEQSKEDIRVLWDKLDPSSIGEITAKGMMLGLYQVQLESWPDLDQAELERLATLINASAVKRLRSGGNNWYKIFNLVDKAQSGRLSFGSLREVLRDMWLAQNLRRPRFSKPSQIHGPLGIAFVISIVSEVALLLPRNSRIPMAGDPGSSSAPGARWSAVLWDIDGTLVNSADLAWSSTNLVLRQNGFKEVSEDEYREATRLTTPKRLAFHATKDVEAGIGGKLAEEFDRHYVQLVSPATVPLFSGLHTLLEDLAKEGVVLGALSNACGAYVRAVLATHGWAETFQTKLGADEVPEAKPAPGGLLKCCEILALRPDRCVYVGDSPGDGKAAKAAGLYSVGVRWGGAAEEDLFANFDDVVGSAEELKAILAPAREDGDLGELLLFRQCQILTTGKSLVRQWFRLFPVQSSGSRKERMIIRNGNGELPGHLEQYGLALSNEQVSDFELKGLWKALDEGKSSSVTVGSFMVFMRRYGVQSHSMSKQKLQSNHLSTMSEEEEWKQMLVEAPALDANRLMSIATELTLGIHTWLNKPGVERSASTQLWPKFIEAANETATTRQGRLKFADFKKTIGKIIRVPPSSNELLAFWREVDRDCTGEALAENFDNAVYRLQVDTWPELDEQGISKVIQILNVAAEKWHRAAGNWYKVFLACDEDGSGSMTYDEMLGVFRKGFPGLSIPPQKLPEQDLRGFWRTLDAHRSGRVEVYDFMIFMRKYGAQYSMHRSSRARKSEVVEDFGHPAERTDDELRQTAQVLDESLTAYWNRRGVHVRAQDKWQRFLDEADLNRDGLVTFQDLEQALIMRLKSGRKFIDDNAMFAFSGKVLAQFSADGAVVNGVSHDDLYALWCRIDADQSGRVSYIEWTNGMYRLRIDTWPLLTEVQQGEVVDKISEAASKWIGNNTNWYKVFKLVDVDCSGSIGYDEFFRIIRRPLPCLAISTKEISNDELKGLWKAMDADLSGSISCQEFMVFMRRLEVRRGFAQWRPQVLSGKGPKASTLARAKAPPAELSPIQFESLKENFRKLRDEDLKKSYDAQGWHWQGSISEWEWPHVIREVLGIPEEQLSDDGVFTAFATLDSENIGEVCVETLLSEERKDPP
eukprot:s1364_g11.t2